MNPLLQEFLLEARDFLQGISEKLMALESAPDDAGLMNELFRLVHTLKGNSGLFDFPALTRVLHAAEDLMDAVRAGQVAYSTALADTLLEAMDFVAALLDEIEATGALTAEHATEAQAQAHALRALIPPTSPQEEGADGGTTQAQLASGPYALPAFPPLAELPEAVRMAAWQAAAPEVPLHGIVYVPAADSFFKGEDPFHQARHIPGLVWGRARHEGPWPALGELDCYRSELIFEAIARAPSAELIEYFRYVPDQVRIEPLPLIALVIPQGQLNGGPVYGDFVAEALAMLEAGDLAGLKSASEALLELSAAELWVSSALRWLKLLIETAPQQRQAMRRLIEALNTLTAPDWQAEDWQQVPDAPSEHEVATAEQVAPADEDRALLDAILAAQAEVLAQPDGVDWLPGRLKATAAVLRAVLSHLNDSPAALDLALEQSLAEKRSQPLAQWLAAYRERLLGQPLVAVKAASALSLPAPEPGPHTPADRPVPATAAAPRAEPVAEVRAMRPAEESAVSKVLKVDQAKIDRLMNLIGEMVVAKNGLPYLASRAEQQYGMRELAREIKAQYAVINRIAEEMQDAIMQVRMLPVSFIFQRFPRLVRDISRKLGKEVELVLEGEETEADKTIIEALAEPLIHIVRNSLDHGLEPPDVRRALGKPPVGRIILRAQQESDRVILEVCDDGKGIDAAIVKRKAYEKGLIDEARLERLSDEEAIQLIFQPGFSTAEQVSDLSGRGVGMDVVRSVVEKIGGTVSLTSRVGQGTTIRLALPLSMAVTNVMIIESHRQIFGVPMDSVIETVRLPRAAIRQIKQQKAAVLRGRIVPLASLNELLGIAAEPQANADDEFAVLVLRVSGVPVGLLVDQFREVIDVILKPLPGVLSKLTQYSGTALLGDGSVLMVINPQELFR